MSEKESECPCCSEMFTSEINSCPNNIEDHKMCSECVEKSHKFFNSKAGCWYCGDREIKVVITNHRNEENSEIDREETRQNYQRLIEILNSIYDENGRIQWKKVFDNIIEFITTTIIIVTMLLIYSLFTYAWSGYCYVFEKYILNKNVDYEVETDPILIVITAMLGFMTTGLIITLIINLYLCCCCCDTRRFIRFGIVEDNRSSRLSRSEVVPV